MFKYLAIIFGTLFMLSVLFVAYQMKQVRDLKEQNLLLDSNITYLSNQMINVQKASEEREVILAHILDQKEQLERQLEEIENAPTEEEKTWLNSIIPTSIDNTIPY